MNTPFGNFVGLTDWDCDGLAVDTPLTGQSTENLSKDHEEYCLRDEFFWDRPHIVVKPSEIAYHKKDSSRFLRRSRKLALAKAVNMMANY